LKTVQKKMLTKKPSKIAVFGAGVWGSIIADHVASRGFDVTLWEHFEHLLHQLEETRRHPHIPNFKFNDRVTLTANLAEAVRDADLLILVISSKAVRPFCKNLSVLLNGRKVPVVSASKGLESGTLLTVTEVLEQELPHLKGQVMALSGPSFALEVARKVPTKINLAGDNPDLLRTAAEILSGSPLRVELSSDRRGVEWGGAVKNVLAIGCGIIDGMGLGSNTKAALITEGMGEMRGLILAAGGREETVFGLAGLGDFILTGTSDISRNRRLGEKLGKGKLVAQARSEISTVAEGADSVESVMEMVKKSGVKAPVINAIWHIVREGAAPDIILKALGF